MKTQHNDARKLVQVSLLVAIMLVLSFTPLGYIPLPGLNATTMHIPVILGACLLGPKVGGFLGFIFGVTSVVRATIEPNLTSFVFTPFYSLSPDFHGSWMSLIVAILPRICIGIVAGYIFQWIAGRTKHVTAALVCAGLAGSMTNTIGVMFLIYLCFGGQFAMAIHKPVEMLITVIMGVIMVNGVAEAIIAAFINTAVYKAMAAALHKAMPNYNA